MIGTGLQEFCLCRDYVKDCTICILILSTVSSLKVTGFNSHCIHYYMALGESNSREMDGILQDTQDLVGSTHRLMEGFVHFYRNPWLWSATDTVHTGEKRQMQHELFTLFAVVPSVFESSPLRPCAISSVSSSSPEVLAQDFWAYAMVSHEYSTYWGKTLDVVQCMKEMGSYIIFSSLVSGNFLADPFFPFLSGLTYCFDVILHSPSPQLLTETIGIVVDAWWVKVVTLVEFLAQVTYFVGINLALLKTSFLEQRTPEVSHGNHWYCGNDWLFVETISGRDERCYHETSNHVKGSPSGHFYFTTHHINIFRKQTRMEENIFRTRTILYIQSCL